MAIVPPVEMSLIIFSDIYPVLLDQF